MYFTICCQVCKTTMYCQHPGKKDIRRRVSRGQRLNVRVYYYIPLAIASGSELGSLKLFVPTEMMTSDTPLKTSPLGGGRSSIVGWKFPAPTRALPKVSLSCPNWTFPPLSRIRVTKKNNLSCGDTHRFPDRDVTCRRLYIC